MKVTMQMLQSLDGFIARNDSDDLSWGSKEDKQFFKDVSSKIGFMIMGGKTYKSMPQAAFKTRRALVLTRNPKNYQVNENVEFFDGSAEQALKHLESKGIKEVLVAGGAEVYSQFLNADLVNEMFITIAPIYLGTGVRAFKLNKEEKFELNEIFELGSSEVALHYKRA